MWSNAMGVSRNIRLFLSPLKLLLFPLLLAISNSFWERKLNNFFSNCGRIFIHFSKQNLLFQNWAIKGPSDGWGKNCHGLYRV